MLKYEIGFSLYTFEGSMGANFNTVAWVLYSDLCPLPTALDRKHW